MKLKDKKSVPVLVAFILIASLALLASCEKYSYELETVDPEEPVLFQTEIQPIFTNSCVACHKGTRDPDLRNGNSFASLTTGGYVSLPAESSKLYTKVISGGHAAFTLPDEKQRILIWIGQGAQNNK